MKVKIENKILKENKKNYQWSQYELVEEAIQNHVKVGRPEGSRQAPSRTAEDCRTEDCRLVPSRTVGDCRTVRSRTVNCRTKLLDCPFLVVVPSLLWIILNEINNQKYIFALICCL